MKPPPSEPTRPLYSVFVKGGEVKDAEGEPVIIGGMVLDIHATPFMPANPRTTTPGKVYHIPGGVARNVAECMSKLGMRPYMISAMGLDMAGDVQMWTYTHEEANEKRIKLINPETDRCSLPSKGNLLLEYWRSAGLTMEGIQRCQDIETSVVCNVFDVKGEVAAGVASVEAIEKFLTPEWIQLFHCNISSAPVVMVDANLHPSALEASCRMAVQSDVPVWFEPVSVVKSRRVVSVVESITFASPNEDELIAMANALSCGDVFHPIQKNNRNIGRSIKSFFQMLRPAIWVLLEKGIKVVIVTLGSDGVFLCSRGPPGFKKNGSKKSKLHDSSSLLYRYVNSSCPPNQFFRASEHETSSNLFAVHFPASPASVVRLTGAGDCLVGATLAGISAGLDVIQSLAVGIAAAKAAVEAETNVPADYNLAKVADDARSVYSAAKMMFCRSML